MDKDPLVRVVRGNPSPDEVAALVIALVTRSAPADTRPPQPTASTWVRSARPAARRPSWRASGLPVPR
ncbi:acyl-CoA carboxylase subunit epsilon [Mangrovihabitans endophyticus]|uniref:acyl-CoA carboxylase subunit epsilon n=1 Tax=Mangrovihabitans endophyticus TaxID=1751298 RepID=UPI00166309D8|nr:acyl-CoA carboxylase subunit epsilon [Mangrovihabitans endophyticus]